MYLWELISGGSTNRKNCRSVFVQEIREQHKVPGDLQETKLWLKSCNQEGIVKMKGHVRICHKLGKRIGKKFLCCCPFWGVRNLFQVSKTEFTKFVEAQNSLLTELSTSYKSMKNAVRLHGFLVALTAQYTSGAFCLNFRTVICSFSPAKSLDLRKTINPP